MNLTMRKKLIISVIAMITLLMIIVTGVYILARMYRSTTDKLILENHEGQALQEFKLSLSKLMVVIPMYENADESMGNLSLNNIMDEVKQSLTNCELILTSMHSKTYLVEMDTMISHLEYSISIMTSENQVDKNALINSILTEIMIGFNRINILIDEVQNEIATYEKRSKTAIIHGSSTILGLGVVLIIVISIAGFLFVNSLTKPIAHLIHATKNISKGKHESRVEVKSGDEFQVLADSFNKMLDVLDNTTVSKEYLNNIINNMFDALLVTNKSCMIQSVNNSACKLLNYKKEELIGQHISILFHTEPGMIANDDESILDQCQKTINTQQSLITKAGENIPAAISCSLLLNQNGQADGLIVVGHDLTDMKAFEKKIEQDRLQSLVAINEAQEQERMRIATDLHDGLGQMLTAISYSIQELHETKDQLPETLNQIQQQFDAAIQETKNLAHNLIPIILKDFGLMAAIQNMIDKANQNSSTKFICNFYDFSDRLDQKLEKAIYRICQESLNNILKHAKAANASYQFFRSNGMVTLVIDDDGIGFDTNSIDLIRKHPGIGLISIRERVASFNGSLTINSQKHKGTELIIEVPCIKQIQNGNDTDINS